MSTARRIPFVALIFVIVFVSTGGALQRAVAQDLDWDPELDDMYASYEPASPAPGQLYWRLIRAWYEDETESGGNHNIYIRCYDQNDQPIQGQKIWMAWPGGAASDYTKGPGLDNYWGNLPMSGGNWCPAAPPPGPYSGYVDGVSDRVNGMGMPCNLHVNYRLEFKLTVASSPDPGTITGTVRSTLGGPVSGAVVRTSPEDLTGVTGSDGAYSIADVPAGTYSVTASRTYYYPQTRSGIEVASGETTTVDFQLTPRDTDGDKIHDPYESAHPDILDPNDPDDAAEDPDGDLATNLDEYRAGTDPEDGASYLHIVDVVISADLTGIEWTSVGGRSYVIEEAPGMDGPWSAVGGPYEETRAGENTLQKVVSRSASDPLQVLRIRLQD